MSDESKEAVAKYLDSLAAHIGADGDMIGSPLIDPVQRVIWNMTGV